MAVDLLRQRQIEGHQDRGPDDGMEAHDLLADEMDVGGPEFREFLRVVEEARRRDIIRQRVEPDIDYMLFVAGHGDAPVEGGARDAEVVEALLDEAHHLVFARRRADEVGIRLDMGQEPVGVVRELEEIRLLRDLFHGAVAIGAAAVLVELELRPVALAGRAVKPRVFPLIDVALGHGATEEFLHHAVMACLAGAQEIVMRDMEPLPERLKARDDLIDISDGRHALLLGGPLDLLPVLVAPRQEEDVIAREALEPRHGIGDRRAIGVPDMQLRARIVDRRRYVKRLARHERFLPVCLPRPKRGAGCIANRRYSFTFFMKCQEAS